MTVYFTADLHFGCDKLVFNTREQFADVKEHDAALMDNINSLVKRTDTLVICGDFCKAHPSKYRQFIRCKQIRFILGNHDKPSHCEGVFGQCHQQLIVKCGSHRVYCSHYAHAHWPSSHYGMMHVYGHTHAQEEKNLDKIWPGRRSMDVGVDNAKRLLGEYRPFSFDEIYELIGSKPGHDMVPPDRKWKNRDYAESE